MTLPDLSCLYGKCHEVNYFIYTASILIGIFFHGVKYAKV
jgi:hypothetical protein